MTLARPKGDRYSVGNAFFEELRGLSSRSPLGISAPLLARLFRSAERGMEEADGFADAKAALGRKQLICAFCSDVPICNEKITEAVLAAWGREWCLRLGRPGFSAPDPMVEGIAAADLGIVLKSCIGESMREGPIGASGGIPPNSGGSKSKN